jgi:hypothetical protein
MEIVLRWLKLHQDFQEAYATARQLNVDPDRRADRGDCPLAEHTGKDGWPIERKP